MKRFANILFCPLGSADNPAAIRRVVDVAKDNAAQMTLLGVVPEPSAFQRTVHPSSFFEAAQEAERVAMTKRITRWQAKCGYENVESSVQFGNQSLKIIQRVGEAGHDLVVVTTDEDQQDHATIQRLLRKCPCPVWVIRPTRARAQRVLAAVNLDPDEQDLNATILELASSMVERFGGDLHVVHAWEPYGVATFRSSAFVKKSRAELDEYIEEERRRRSAGLAKLLGAPEVSDAPWTVHLERGGPEDVVRQVVATCRINLLVMGTLARTGVPGLLIGNTAERILDNVRCSVIAVKPPDFRSPLS